MQPSHRLCSDRHEALRSLAKLQSAGILLFCLGGNEVEVLLAHPGGPFWRHKDHGSWTIPKGLIDPGGAPLPQPSANSQKRPDIILTANPYNAKQPSGKLVHIWAVRDDWNPADLRSNGFEINGRLDRGDGKCFRKSTARLGLRLVKRASEC